MLSIRDVQIDGLPSAMDYARLPMLPLSNPVGCHSEEPREKKIGRASRLAGVPMGTGHDNFLKGITVRFIVDFTVKAWVQAERYSHLDFISSMSTMHSLTKEPLTAEMFSPYTDPAVIIMVQGLWEKYQDEPTQENLLALLYSVPVGLKVPAAMITNYQQLKTIFFQRRNHKLPEWREFCGWIETLPFFKEWIINKGETTNG